MTVKSVTLGPGTTSWTVPADCGVIVRIQVWAGGGGGASANPGGGGGGGGYAEYSAAALQSLGVSFSPGAVIQCRVGAGGAADIDGGNLWFGYTAAPVDQVFGGGKGKAGSGGTAGGAGAAGLHPLAYPGGAGGGPGTGGSGGGGGSGGPDGAGHAAGNGGSTSGSSGGYGDNSTAYAPGGGGANVGSDAGYGTGTPGRGGGGGGGNRAVGTAHKWFAGWGGTPGGGGGGGWAGGGGDGAIIITYQTPVPPMVFSFDGFWVSSPTSPAIAITKPTNMVAASGSQVITGQYFGDVPLSATCSIDGGAPQSAVAFSHDGDSKSGTWSFLLAGVSAGARSLSVAMQFPRATASAGAGPFTAYTTSVTLTGADGSNGVNGTATLYLSFTGGLPTGSKLSLQPPPGHPSFVIAGSIINLNVTDPNGLVGTCQVQFTRTQADGTYYVAVQGTAGNTATSTEAAYGFWTYTGD